MLFFVAGAIKLVVAGAFARDAGLPPLILMVLGMAEVAGALVVALPALRRIGHGLASLAAAGLIVDGVAVSRRG